MSPKLIRPRRHADTRGWFSETWNRQKFAAHGIDCEFVQDNQSLSIAKGTIRGLHFQAHPHAQAKLVRCIKGRIFDVALDIRSSSPTFGRWVGSELGEDDGLQLFIPEGFAHGFLTLEEGTVVAYKVSSYYAPDADCGIFWRDPSIGISWPVSTTPILSPKDASLPAMTDIHTDFPYDGVPLEELMEIEL